MRTINESRRCEVLLLPSPSAFRAGSSQTLFLETSDMISLTAA
jgi:hypothetical protein